MFVAPAHRFVCLTDQCYAFAHSWDIDARPLKQVLADYSSQHGELPREVTVFVGPEGDFTPAEIALAKSHGCQPITLGPIILRTETAAIYCLSVLAHELFIPARA